MNLDDLKQVYFIGIGGIGMSALARYFNDKGVKVSGYDKTESVLTKKLVSEGISVHYQDDVKLIPGNIDMVVYTPAVSKKNKQLNKLQKCNVPVIKRSELLGLLAKSHDAIAIAGTHGKTSTTAITAHIMRTCGMDVSAFIGGILADYDTNYFAGDGQWIVLEADEYDHSFLRLHPEISVLQSMDPDHLDIYGSHEVMVANFIAFLNQTEYGGKLILNYSLLEYIDAEAMVELKGQYSVITFGFSNLADAVITDTHVDNGMSGFTLQYKGESVEVLQYLPGDHNRLNATAALLATSLAGCNMQEAANALSVFKGIKRRYEIVARRDVVYVDDYAHHPKELNAAIQATRELFPDARILGIFQPHLYSRTRDFAEEFGRSLEVLDEVVLMDIYPAREEPIKGVTSSMILNYINHNNKSLLEEEAIIEKVKERNYDVIMTLGAGDIDLLVPVIKDIILNYG
jgi:UDP-N-acetylmuramate--alanine ligase